MSTLSPDFTPYVDMRGWDVDHQTIVTQALADAPTKFPGWVPQETAVAVVLLDTLAAAVEQLIFAVDRTPNAFLGGLVGLMGATQSPGVAPTATVTITANDLLGHTVATGTQFVLSLNGPIPRQIVFATTASLAIAVGDPSGTVAVQAVEYTADANGTGIGVPLTTAGQTTPWINTVVLASAPTAGVNPEGPLEYLLRASQYLRRLTLTWCRASDVESRVLQEPAVFRCHAVDLWDGTATTPGHVLGHTSVVCCGAAGTAVAGGTLTALLADLQAGAQADVAFHIFGVTTVMVDVVATVKKRAGYSDAQVRADVAAVLGVWLNPDSWQWGAPVNPAAVLAEIDRAPTVAYVDTIAAPAVVVTLSPKQLPVLGTITLTIA